MDQQWSSFLLGCGIGAGIYWAYTKYRINTFNSLGNEIIQKAELEIEKKQLKADYEIKEKHFEQQRKLEDQWKTERTKIAQDEARLKQQQDSLDERIKLFENRHAQFEKRESVLKSKEQELAKREHHFQEQEEALKIHLERTSGLSSQEAKDQLLALLEDEIRIESARFLKKSLNETEQQAERSAARILASAINRLAASVTAEATVNTVALPSDELKSRIIGKEGRNIRTLERLTGVAFLIDDTPGTVVLSSFDPVKLHVAKQALQDLLKDGRIHPTKIEEAVEKAKLSIEKKIHEAGEHAALRCGQANLHPQILQLLGKLSLRYSYGQNILEHSVEVSHLMGMIASELHLDAPLAKRIGLLHDIGKAVSHEIPGTHALIGKDLVLKYGESNEVANGIGCHHNEIPPITIEGSFCGAADAVSASRPGARSEGIEEYIKRMRKLEDLAYGFKGVEKAYALQAGKELCVAVIPELIDDQGSLLLAREISKKIENEHRYGGKIKVTVIREKRAVEYAL